MYVYENKVARNEKRKKQLWVFVYLYKICQFLKHFSWAQTLKWGGVSFSVLLILLQCLYYQIKAVQKCTITNYNILYAICMFWNDITKSFDTSLVVVVSWDNVAWPEPSVGLCIFEEEDDTSFLADGSLIFLWTYFFDSWWSEFSK